MLGCVPGVSSKTDIGAPPLTRHWIMSAPKQIILELNARSIKLPLETGENHGQTGRIGWRAK